MSFNAMQMAGLAGGSTVLTYLAARNKTKDTKKHTFRLSLDSNNSLIGDVRVLGGLICAGASMYTSGDTKATLRTIAFASALSVLATEVVRYNLKGTGCVEDTLPIFPVYGALPGPTPGAQYGAQHQHAGWAAR